MEELLGGMLGIFLEFFGDLFICELLIPGVCKLLGLVCENVKTCARFICGEAWERWRRRRQASGIR